MFCKYCGKEVDETATFCQHCGAAIKKEENNSENTSESLFDQPVSASAEQIVPEKPPVVYPMKWWKFLVYFLLFAGAVLNLFSGIGQLTGSIYEEVPGDGSIEMVYRAFPALKPIDIIVGLLTIGLAVFAIFVRQALYKFKAIGPKLLIIMYAASCIINAVYCVAVFIVVPEIAQDMMTDFITTIATGIIMVVVNIIYFRTRKELFVN